MHTKVILLLCLFLATGLAAEDFKYNIKSQKTFNEDYRTNFADHLGDVIFIEAFSTT